jgi:beta-phosphoglucomutase
VLFWLHQYFVKQVFGACALTDVHAYLVDFDGTLADTGDANYLAYASALQEIGISYSREQFDQEAFGRNWRQFLPMILKGYGSSADATAIAARKVELYRDTARHVSFNEALVILLNNKNPKIKTALVTSASSANVMAALAGREELRHLFDVIVTGDDVTRHKPDPEGYRIAAERLGVLPENCIVFEDSDIGIMAGRAFGAHVLQIRFQ